MAQKGYRQRKSKNKNNNHDVLGVSLIIASLFLLLCIVIPPILSVVSQAIFSMILGVFGIVAYPALIAMFLWGLCLVLRRPLYVSAKNVICISLLVFFAMVILQLATTHAFLKQSYSGYISDTYAAKYSMGGIVFGTIAFGLKTAITEVGCYIVFSLGVLIVVAVMTNVIARIRARRAAVTPVEMAKMPPAPGFDTRMEPQNVMPVENAPGLFVGTIERRTPPVVVTESGRASDIRPRDKRAVSDYGDSPVISRAEPKQEPVKDSASTAAHTLYGDSEELKKKSAEEYRRMAEENAKPKAPVEPERPVRSESEYVEPYIRTAYDAQSNTSAGKPKKVVHESHDVFFPVEKNLVFNDDGIENADDIKRRLQEDTKKRKLSDMGVSEPAYVNPALRDGPHEQPVVPPEMFMPVKRVEPVRPAEPESPIIDVDGDRATRSVFEPAPQKSDVAPQKAESADDRFLRTLGSDSHKDMPRFEPAFTQDERQDDIINTDIINGTASVFPSEPEDSDIDPDDIIVGDVPETPAPAPARSSVFGAAQSDDLDAGIIDGIEGLTIDNGPAVDMSEKHDITSDLINGDDLSGLYVTASEQEPVQKPSKRAKGISPIDNQISIQSIIDQKSESVLATAQRKRKSYNYTPPPIDLLKRYPDGDISQELLDRNSRLLEQVISDHLKVESKVINVVPGPTVTRYEVECPMGTNVNQIGTESCITKIMYELMAYGTPRIEAPIPGKRAVGIEIPNEKPAIVGIRDIIESDVFKNSKSPMTFAVGKGISGDIVTCNLEKVPHLLIAGQTGSGKSACLNGLIVSLMFKSSPEDLRFILIDPKRVEFSAYAGMPHLLFNKILVDSKEVFNALKWAENEMERRYTLLSQARCNQISMYNKSQDVVSGKVDKLPHIIVICDELGNLMLSNDKQGIEDKIKNIAAKARAAGIHLILATQRPSADVITGTIKANLTSQIAFKVGKQIDSRIILDEAGAETLVGKGDMLFYPDEYNAPKRVQGSFISEEEVMSVIDYLLTNVECDFDEEAEKAAVGADEFGSAAEAGANKAMSDPLLAEVLALVIKTKQASTSGIQRRFSIGFARASRLIDTMEDLKYIGPSTGNSKPRDVYITAEQYREMFGRDVEES